MVVVNRAMSAVAQIVILSKVDKKVSPKPSSSGSIQVKFKSLLRMMGSNNADCINKKIGPANTGPDLLPIKYIKPVNKALNATLVSIFITCIATLFEQKRFACVNLLRLTFDKT